MFSGDDRSLERHGFCCLVNIATESTNFENTAVCTHVDSNTSNTP